MVKPVNLIGQIFTRLTVIERAENNKYNKVCWLCKCICGNEIITSTNSLRRGNTKSCGCLRKEIIRKIHTLPHGEAAFHHIYDNYKCKAKRKGIEFNLTIK